MGGWIAFPQGLIGGSDPRREGELRRTSWRTSSPSPKPPQADRRGGAPSISPRLVRHAAAPGGRANPTGGGLNP